VAAHSICKRQAERGTAKLTAANRMRNNRCVQIRKPLAAALLLMTFAALPLLWLGAHALEHDGHAEEATGSGVEWSDLAKILVHGHEHAEGTPDHEHYLLPSPTLRPDPPRDLQVPAVASLEALNPESFLLASARSRHDELRVSPQKPPLRHLLCALLI
jgi:hypothetical protein